MRRELKKKTLDSMSSSIIVRAVSHCREKNNQVKTSTRRNKSQYVERYATEADGAAERKYVKTVCQITAKIRGDRGQNLDLTVKSKDGSTITEEQAKQ